MTTTNIIDRVNAIAKLAEYSGQINDVGRTRAAIDDLKNRAKLFEIGGLKMLQLEHSYEIGNKPYERWECAIALPTAPVTRESRMQEIRRAVSHWSVAQNANEDVVRFIVNDNARQLVPSIVNVLNANAHEFNAANKTKHNGFKTSALRELMQRIKDLLPEIASRGRVWDCTEWYRKDYTPRRVMYKQENANPLETRETYDSDFDSDQRLIENVDEIETKIVFELNPFRLDIQETTTVSRQRKRRYMLENL